MRADKQIPTRIDEYNYDLPDHRIAKYPLTKRDESKLLVWKNGDISESRFASLAEYIPENSLLIYNNTRVIHARIVFRKTTGARIEVFCLEPINPADYALSLGATGSCEWKCMVGNLKKWKEGKLIRTIEVSAESIELSAEITERNEGSHTVRFEWENDNISFSEILMAAGELPIPPYLHRATEESDKQNYQTVYSSIEGSVAAPTAGLHFTPEVFESLHQKGLEFEKLTLHVGAGTFQPVKTETVEEHRMHTESFVISRNTIENIVKNLGNIVAVGTTTVRTLESLFYVGKKISESKESGKIVNTPIKIEQWEAYEEKSSLSISEALTEIAKHLDEIGENELHCETEILIKPGFEFKLTDTMITNFHQPGSTLLLLVSAFVDGNWQAIYDYALENNFRFLSYGDSSILMK